MSLLTSGPHPNPLPPCPARSGHQDSIRCLASADVSPSPRVISGSHDCTLRLWDVDAKATEREFVGHTALVFAAAVTPAKLVVSGKGGRSGRWVGVGASAATPCIIHVLSSRRARVRLLLYCQHTAAETTHGFCHGDACRMHAAHTAR